MASVPPRPTTRVITQLVSSADTEEIVLKGGHVGIVVGPGMMIDAPHTGAYVELTSYYWPDLVPMGARP